MNDRKSFCPEVKRAPSLALANAIEKELRGILGGEYQIDAQYLCGSLSYVYGYVAINGQTKSGNITWTEAMQIILGERTLDEILASDFVSARDYTTNPQG